MLFEQKLDIKFRFVEDFPTDEEVDYAAQLREEPEEPKKTKTKFFGELELHQIARVEWRTVEMTVEREKYDANGRVTYSEEKVVMYEMMKGELGGWLESLSNLSQEGNCWVHADGYVMGAASVYGDAEVKGGAEVGGSARVGDKVVLDGKFGVGGSARILDEAKVKGQERMAVFGSAVVRGKSEILEEAQAYGHAKIGDLEHKAILMGRARAYGNCIVKGTVKDDCEVFGRAEVRGRMEDRCWVGGTAFIGSYAAMSGDIIISRGTVNGTISGTGLINWPEFILHNASTLKLKSEADDKDPKDDYEEATDEMEDRSIDANASEVKWVRILPKCYVSDCEFKGRVTIRGGSLEDCIIEDSVLGTYDDTYNFSSILWQGRIFAQDCEFKGCVLPRGEFYDCKFERVWSPPDWAVTATSCEAIDTALLEQCRNIRDCKLDNSSVMAQYVTKLKSAGGNERVLYDCALIETHGRDEYWGRYHPDNPYRTLIWPDEFKDILDEREGVKYSGVEKLDGIAAYVYKYDGYHKYLLDMTDVQDSEGLEEDLAELREKRDEVYKERTEWFKEVIDGLTEKEKAAAEEEKAATEKKNKAKDKVLGAKDGEEKKTAEKELAEAEEKERLAKKKHDNLKAIIAYVNLFKGMDWYVMSEDSYQKIRGEILKTVDSLEDYSFIPYSDFGEITVDPAFGELQDKYRVSLAIDSSAAWYAW